MAATASYTGGSGSNALTFSYTVGAGDDTSDLTVTAFNLNGATVSDAAGNSADLSGAAINPTGTLQIDTIAPTVPSVVASGSGIDGSGNGDLNAGHVVTLTINMSEVVTVAGGVPTLSLNNGGYGELHRRLRQQRPHLQLHGWRRRRHQRPYRHRVQPERGDGQRRSGQQRRPLGSSNQPDRHPADRYDRTDGAIGCGLGQRHRRQRQW